MNPASQVKLGLIGRGNWGNVYAKTLTDMGIEFRQMGRDWNAKGLDGVIIASSGESHFPIAKCIINSRIPCLIEKPITMSHIRAERLLNWAERYKNAIVFTGHTRLYSPAWKEFKYGLPDVVKVEAQAGGKCKMRPMMDWGSHLAAMCLDIGFNPANAAIRCENHDLPFRFIVNDEYVFDDPPTIPKPLNVLIGEFIKAIDKGVENLDGLRLGVEVMKYLDTQEK